MIYDYKRHFHIQWQNDQIDLRFENMKNKKVF